MPFTPDDADELINRLAGPLLPADRAAFRAAAEDALTRVPCWGEGAVYRAVSALQRAYFHPPSDTRAASTGARHYRPNKLMAKPPIGAEDIRMGDRSRRRLRLVAG
jgi:hypothetical protein